MGSLELLSYFWSLNTIWVVQIGNFDFGGLSHPPTYDTISTSMAMSEKHLPPRKQSVCSSHGLDDKGGGEKGHEGEEDEDDRGKKVASIFEGRWQCEGSSADDQIEDID